MKEFIVIILIAIAAFSMTDGFVITAITGDLIGLLMAMAVFVITFITILVVEVIRIHR